VRGDVQDYRAQRRGFGRVQLAVPGKTEELEVGEQVGGYDGAWALGRHWRKGSKRRLSVLEEHKARGAADVLILCFD
jgi:hypothetical protein